MVLPGRLGHSEHALRLLGDPVEVPADPRISIREAVQADGRPIGTVRLIPEGDGAGVYGFVIEPDHQGRGIGRDVLHRLCRTARAAVHLEVATDNDRALNLYTSLGFRPVITEDYYAMPVTG